MNSRMPPMSNFAPMARRVGYGVLALFAVIGIFSTTYTVDQKDYGVVTRFGKIVNVTDPGLHFKMPFIEDVQFMPARLISHPIVATTVSKDMQEVTTNLNIQYKIPRRAVESIYADYGVDVEALTKAFIEPAAQASSKTVTAQFTAEQLISLRPRVTTQMQEGLSKNVARVGLILDKLEVVNFKFSDKFTEAIENKVVAQQAVLTEGQNLERLKVVAKQGVAKAEGEAQATRLRADAEAYALTKQNAAATELTVRLREAEAKLVMAEAEKLKGTNWRPNVVGATPLVNVPSTNP